MFDFLKREKRDVKLFCHTDVHCHILPGVDHGSQSVEQSLAMLEEELRMGVNRVICTSHVTAETFENTPQTLTRAYEKLCRAVSEAKMDIELHVSAEYRIDEYWQREYAAGHVLPMPGNYVLLENSFQQELLSLDQMLFEMMLKGYKPILAHPERYNYYTRRRQRYTQLHNQGVKFQINILSLTGYFGASARDNVLWLIKNGMVDLVGTDMHNLEHARIIRDYLRTRDWRKISERIEPHIINDQVV